MTFAETKCKTRFSLTTIRGSEKTKHTKENNKDLTPGCGSQFDLANFDEGKQFVNKFLLQRN
jgi:hypothetical protein